MPSDEADDLVLFRDVRIIRATPPALLCGIGDKSVWLLRSQISGKLWRTGDRGNLFIRRGAARDRRLMGPDAATDSSLVPSLPLVFDAHHAD